MFIFKYCHPDESSLVIPAKAGIQNRLGGFLNSVILSEAKDLQRLRSFVGLRPPQDDTKQDVDSRLRGNNGVTIS